MHLIRQNHRIDSIKLGDNRSAILLNLSLDRYDSGDLIINGKSTKMFKEREWDAYRNNSIGFIFQSYNLISHLSILANVEMGMTLSGVSASEKHRRATEALEKVIRSHGLYNGVIRAFGKRRRHVILAAEDEQGDIISSRELSIATSSISRNTRAEKK